MELISHSLTPRLNLCGIRSLIGFGNLVRPLVRSVLYLHETYLRLALKLFRGEPAISEFDWNFSATHSSSQNFSTFTGSVLHRILLRFQPDHGYVTRFRVYGM